MADSKRGGEIHIESWSFGGANAADATAGELKAPPSGEDAGGAGPHVKVFDGSTGSAAPDPRELSADPVDGETAAGEHSRWINVTSVNLGGHKAGGGSSSDAGGEHEVEYDIMAGKVAGPVEPEAIGSANGGVWKTTNFGPDGETSSVGGKMHVEDISLGATEPEAFERSAPTVSEIVVTKTADAAAAGLASESPDQATHGAGGGAGKVSVHDISIVGEDDGPSSFAALEPDGDPEAYLEYRLQNVKVTSYSVNGAGLDASDDDGPSSLAPLTPDDGAERSGEQTYLAIKLENVQITSYSLNSEEAPDDLAGGTESEDSWEDAL